MILQRAQLVTVSLWLLLVVALGYWRMFYAWRLGSVIVFLSIYLPILALLLLIALLLQNLYFARRGEP
jgi:hypothetical protein